MTRNSADFATIFDVQRFCLHDGPGIRSTVFFKGCPLRCVWCQNPESQKGDPEMAFYANSCQACDRCFEVCPANAISKASPRRIEFSRCDSCGDCASVCQFGGIRKIGKQWHVDDLIREILLDEDFFDDSGGGVTLSGGEPMQQSEFLENLLPKLKKEGIHVNLQTCGVCSWKLLKAVLPHLDLVYFDIKHLDSEKHKAFTRVGNEVPLANLAHLSEASRNVVPRMPIIPGFNDDSQNIKATAAFLKKIGFESIHCLAYHRLGESKLHRIETVQEPINLRAPNMGKVRQAFLSEGIDAILCD